MQQLKDGRLVAFETLKAAYKIKKMYVMDLDTLIGCLFDFDVLFENKGFAEMSSNFHKYRRGYLLKCDELFVKVNQ